MAKRPNMGQCMSSRSLMIGPVRRDFLSFGVVLLLTSSVMAQTTDSSSQAAKSTSCREFCFKGAPAPSCRMFAIVEAGLTYPISQPDFIGNENRPCLTIDIGLMRNVGKRSALGLTAYFSAHESTVRQGIRVRYRHWLGHRLALDISPVGLFAGKTEDVDRRSTGFISSVALNVSDLMAVTIGLVAERYSSEYYDNSSAKWKSIHTSGTSLYAGLTGGTYAGIVGAAVIIVVTVYYGLRDSEGLFGGSSWG